MDDQALGGREKDWHEEAPRIIASGRWEQDEYGAATYIPDHVRPSTAERAEAPPPNDDDAPRGHYYEDPAPRDGYRVRPDAVWAAARRDYLAGETAEAVCDRHGLKLGTLRSRAAREGWRRCDAEDDSAWLDPWPDDEEPVEEGAADVPDLAAMAAQALMRLNRRCGAAGRPRRRRGCAPGAPCRAWLWPRLRLTARRPRPILTRWMRTWRPSPPSPATPPVWPPTTTPAAAPSRPASRPSAPA